MYIFDSCAIRGIFHNQNQYPLLKARYIATPYEHLFTSIIVVRENMEWALKAVKGNERLGRYPQAYRFLLKMAIDHAKFQVLPFDEHDLEIFNSFPPETRSIGKTDRFIAATAIRHNYTVVTMNTRHFEPIPNCHYVDWSR